MIAIAVTESASPSGKLVQDSTGWPVEPLKRNLLRIDAKAPNQARSVPSFTPSRAAARGNVLNALTMSREHYPPALAGSLVGSGSTSAWNFSLATHRTSLY